MINIISIVSAAAIGIGCMALIVILSVYNGFDKIVESSYNSYIPDYVIVPAKGKTISLSDERIKSAIGELGTGKVFPVLEETVYVQYDVVQSIAKIKGVPAGYEELERLQDNMADGDFALSFGSLPRAVVEENLAWQLMLRPQFSTPLELYLPSRTEDISLMMPSSSLLSEEIRPAGIITLSSTEDRGTIYIPDSLARELMEYGKDECSRIEIFLDEGSLPVRQIRATLGDGYVLKDRYQQNETIYKMMRAEKFAIYMILLFVVAVISVNLLASLSMLIIEKKEDIQTYQAMGMKPSSIRRTFALHGWLICMAGAVIGIILGLLLCFIQYKWGVISLPGNFAIDHYPVVVKASDIVLTLLSVAVIGVIMACIPTRNIRTK